MKVECYNASECPISQLQYGDTCYYNNELCIKTNVSAYRPLEKQCWIVFLGRGELLSISNDTLVTFASTKVVAD